MAERSSGHLKYETFRGVIVVPTPPDAPYQEGDEVVCLEGFTSQFFPQNHQEPGDRFIVRAYLSTHDYLVLDTLAHEDPDFGWVNASRFKNLTR